MGRISKLVLKNLSSSKEDNNNSNVTDIETKRRTNEVVKILKDKIEELKRDGISPLYSVYMQTIQFIYYPIYSMAEMNEFKDFSKIKDDRENIYLPSYPPMSPISESYYTQWELFDARAGKEKETLAGIFLDVAEYLGVDKETIDITTYLSNSRMGVYEIRKKRDRMLFLRELITEDEFWGELTPGGYEGEVGQLWYTRFLPDINEKFGYSTISTTPYVLMNKKREWMKFFKEYSVSKEQVHNFMKFGPDLNFWNEFIFYRYYNFTDQAIFLKGMPGKIDSYELP